MKKYMSVLVLPLMFAACSSDKGMESIPNASASTEETDVKLVPFFAFAEDGSRLDYDIATGEYTPKVLERKTLVLNEDESFETLRTSYLKRIHSDKGFAASIEQPMNYFCDDEMLAINAEYEKVVSAAGEVLLDDQKLKDGCVLVETSAKALKKTSDFSFRDFYYFAPGNNFYIQVMSDLVDENSSSTYRCTYSRTKVYKRIYDAVNGVYNTYAYNVDEIKNASMLYNKNKCYVNSNGQGACSNYVPSMAGLSKYGVSVWDDEVGVCEKGSRSVLRVTSAHLIRVGSQRFLATTSTDEDKARARAMYDWRLVPTYGF